MDTTLIFEFNKNADIRNWQIVDDVVMGGRSMGRFALNTEGYGLFSGNISLDNNGGFSSVRYTFKKIKVNKDSQITLKIKGDGKEYQFRVKNKSEQYYSYISSFKTTGEWQEIKISLKDMYPSFRGRKLDMPNFPHDGFEELAFLIGNKKPERFELMIEKISIN